VVIVDPPRCFGSTTRSFEILDNVSETRSVYSFSESRIDFGGEAWSCELQMHNLNDEQAGEITAYFDRLRGVDVAARFGFAQSRKTKFGTTTAAALTVTADVVAGGNDIPISGVGAAGTLRWGTVVQIGNHLHRSRTNVTGDTGSLIISPRLRAPLTTGDQIILDDPKGLWRLQGRPVEQHSKRWTLGGGVRFVEALNYA